MALTAGGQRLVGIASQMIDLAAEAEAAIRQAQGAPERLRVVATSTVAEFVAPPLLDAFTSRAATVEASVGVSAASEMAALLLERLADVGLGPRLSGDGARGILSEPMMRYRLIVVASPRHRLARGGPIAWRALGEQDWLVDPSGTDNSTEVGMLLEHLHVPSERVKVFPSQAAAWAAAADGEGVAPAIAHLVAQRDQSRRTDAPRCCVHAGGAALVREHARPRTPLARGHGALPLPRDTRGHAEHAPQRWGRAREPFPAARLRDDLELRRSALYAGRMNLKLEVDPSDVGFAPDRLTRMTAHLRRYVDDGRLPGWSIVLSRGGQIAHLDTYGKRDVEAGTPIELDTIFRIYSMTKPITTVAAMMLWEEGAFELHTPVRRFVPSFADTKVFRAGSTTSPILEGRTEELELWHLMTHTSGLTYGFMYANPVDDLYRRAGFEWDVPRDTDLEGVCDKLAELPLLFQPGREWNYSMSTDVLGRVIEVVSGMPLDQFFRERLFEPLGMSDTGFFVPPDDLQRLARLYTPMPGTRQAVPLDAMGKRALSPPVFFGGGGGLVSTLADYHRFTQLLVARRRARRSSDPRSPHG